MNHESLTNGLSANIGHDIALFFIALFRQLPGVTSEGWGNRLPNLLAALSIAALGLIVNFVIFELLRRWKKRERLPGSEMTLWDHVARWISKPLHVTVWVFGIYLAVTALLAGLHGDELHPFQRAADRIVGFCVLMVLAWLFFRVSRAVEGRLRQWTAKSDSKIDDLLVPMAGKFLRVIVPVIAVILLLPTIELPFEYNALLSKASSILIIGAITWALFQTVHFGEKLVMSRFDISVADNLRAREVYTQVTVLKKTLYVIIAIFAMASVLMLFEEVRRLGTSILASAGVVGIIIGFAAQKTIANLFSGFQLAMTQPIRIDDVVIVEGEWGRIEEITLTYVVVRIWDLRRLIVPISFFIEKPFQNWTRVSADILGTIFLYADYSIPVDALRQELNRIVSESPLWDKKVCGLQVTNTTDKTVELRALVSASDASKAWDLRCEVREKLLSFVQRNFAGSLPKVRAELAGSTLPAPAH